MLFAVGSDQMMAVFTDVSRIPAEISSKAPFAVRLLGKDLLGGLQPGVGLVINPGTVWGFEILPVSVAAIIAEFGRSG